MKKNFVKKLALGLALVMAVTSVPVSSEAAAKPAFKTASVEVKEGETVKAVIKKTKGWKVKKVASKNEEVAKVVKFAQKAKKTNVKVEGVKAGETKVVATLKKGDSKVKAKLAVTVKAEEKATMTVEATGVKEITVKFNKAVDTASTVTVKKGTVAPTFTATWAEDATSVVLTMGSKLTKGTYDVTVGELTGSVTTEDEKVASIEIVGTNLVLTDKEAKDEEGSPIEDAVVAEIGFKELNQYGERMSGTEIADITVASSFGTGKATSKSKVAENGVAEVIIASPVLQIVGTKGTITVIDAKNGLTTTAEVELSAKATPTTMTVAGIYNTTDGEFKGMYRGCNPAEYALLVQVKDQYDNELKADALKKALVVANFVGSVTNVNIETEKVDGKDIPAWDEEVINDVTYIKVPFIAGEAKNDKDELTNVAAVGTFYFTFVNPNAGLLASLDFTVSDSTVVKAVNVYTEDTIYNNIENVLGYEVIDAEGNAVTKYSVLKDTVKFELASGDDGKIDWAKQADGTALLVYKPGMSYSIESNNKETALTTIMVTANPDIPTSYMVKPVNFTVSEDKVPTEVIGLKSTAPTAIATGTSVTVDLEDLVIEDQYANVLTLKELKDAAVKVMAKVDDETPIAITKANSLELTGEAEGTVKVAYYVSDSQKADDAYVVKYSVVNAMKATNLSIVYVNCDYTIEASNNANVAAGLVNETIETIAGNYDTIMVMGTVGGKKVILPNSQYVVSGYTVKSLGSIASGAAVTVATGNVEITVDTVNGPVVLTKEVTYSNAPAVVTTLEVADEHEALATTINAEQLAKLFDIESQYLGVEPINKGEIKYTLTYLGDDKRTITHNATKDVEVEAKANDAFAVTATIGDLTATTTFVVGKAVE